MGIIIKRSIKILFQPSHNIAKLSQHFTTLGIINFFKNHSQRDSTCDPVNVFEIHQGDCQSCLFSPTRNNNNLTSLNLTFGSDFWCRMCLGSPLIGKGFPSHQALLEGKRKAFMVGEIENENKASIKLMFIALCDYCERKFYPSKKLLMV